MKTGQWYQYTEKKGTSTRSVQSMVWKVWLQARRVWSVSYYSYIASHVNVRLDFLLGVLDAPVKQRQACSKWMQSGTVALHHVRLEISIFSTAICKQFGLHEVNVWRCYCQLVSGDTHFYQQDADIHGKLGIWHMHTHTYPHRSWAWPTHWGNLWLWRVDPEYLMLAYSDAAATVKQITIRPFTILYEILPILQSPLLVQQIKTLLWPSGPKHETWYEVRFGIHNSIRKGAK